MSDLEVVSAMLARARVEMERTERGDRVVLIWDGLYGGVGALVFVDGALVAAQAADEGGGGIG